jgi:predicted metal-dependent peptidase
MTQLPSGPVAERLAAAKLWLVSGSADRESDPDAPAGLTYLSRALYGLVPVPSASVERLAGDEHWRLYLNERWVSETAVPEIGRELAHIVWHLLMSHAVRARSLFVGRSTAAAWGLAADLVISHTLAEDHCVAAAVQEMAEGESGRALVTKAGALRTPEEYFALLSGLPAPPTDGGDERDPGGHGESGGRGDELPACGSVCDGIPREYDLPPDEQHGLDSVQAQQIRKSVAIAFQQRVTMRGDEVGEALRWARSLTEPQISWEVLLTRAVRRAVGWASGRSEYTWTRPSRRQPALPDVRLPGLRRLVPRVAVIVDTSASMDDELLGLAMGEVTGALAALGVAGASLTVYSCDAAVGAVTEARRAADVVLTGGGGTDLTVAFTHLQTVRPRPDVVVVLTDGFTPWPETGTPGAACVIGLLGRRGDEFPPTPEWAVRIECVRD